MSTRQRAAGLHLSQESHTIKTSVEGITEEPGLSAAASRRRETTTKESNGFRSFSLCVLTIGMSKTIDKEHRTSSLDLSSYFNELGSSKGSSSTFTIQIKRRKSVREKSLVIPFAISLSHTLSPNNKNNKD